MSHDATLAGPDRPPSQTGFRWSDRIAPARPAQNLDSVMRARTTESIQARGDTPTPSDVLDAVLEGNRRFVSGRRKQPALLTSRRSASAEERQPSAIFLTCADSPALVETVCDLEVGDVWNIQMAANIVNEDILGSMESAVVTAGAKLIMVMGHASCGVIRSAIDHVRLGHMKSLMAKLDGAIAAAQHPGRKSGRNPAFVDAVAATHVRLTMDMIRARSTVLRDLEIRGRIVIAGSMYDASTGRVTLV